MNEHNGIFLLFALIASLGLWAWIFIITKALI